MEEIEDIREKRTPQDSFKSNCWSCQSSWYDPTIDTATARARLHLEKRNGCRQVEVNLVHTVVVEFRKLIIERKQEPRRHCGSGRCNGGGHFDCPCYCQTCRVADSKETVE